MASRDQIRLLVVEDVPQVAQYIRNLLTAQAVVKLLDIVPEGSRAAADVAELRPDVVVIDALLQGKVKAPAILEQLRKDGMSVPVILLTVPQTPIKADPNRGINGVLTMDLSGQACAHCLESRTYSGVGGAFEFAYGAQQSPGGKSIHCLAARATLRDGRVVSNIVARHPSGTRITIPESARCRPM